MFILLIILLVIFLIFIIWQSFKPSKFDHIFIPKIEEGKTRKISFDKVNKYLGTRRNIHDLSCPKCRKKSEDLDWFEFSSSKESWANLAGCAGYYCFCSDCEQKIETFITVIN